MEEKVRILVVDDDAGARSIYVEILKEAGFSVSEAGDGLEALQKVHESQPDLIMSGIIMPKMDGFSLVENLRKNVVTAHIPIVFLSHLGRQEDEVRAKEMGVNDFIVGHSTPPREVIARIKALLSSAEYILGLDPKSYDGQKFARDMGLPADFLCMTAEGERYVLRLRLKDANAKRFDGELICV